MPAILPLRASPPAIAESSVGVFSPLKVFISYSHRDDNYRDALVRHLAPLEDDGLISVWHDRKIAGGENWIQVIDRHLAEAEIVLLLISSDFMASDYCRGIEVLQALAMHEAGTARVIPVVLRSCRWRRPPIGNLQPLPKDGVAITESAHPDKLYSETAAAIEEIAESLRNPSKVDAKGKWQFPRQRQLRLFLHQRLFAWLTGGGLMLAVAAGWTAEGIKASVRDNLRIDRPDQAEALLDSVPKFLAPLWPGLSHLQEVARLSREGAEAGVDSAVLERQLNELLNDHPDDADLRYLAARQALVHRDLKALETHAQRVLLVDAAHAATWNLRGLAADLQGDSETALSHYMKASDLQPTVPQFTVHRARALLDQGRAEEALPLYQREVQIILARAESALAFWSLGQLESARDSQVQALELLETPNIFNQRTNVFDWVFIYPSAKTSPDPMNATYVRGQEKTCYVAYELAISRHLLNSASSTVAVPHECAQVRRLDEIVAVINADLCRYLVQRQPVWAEAVQKLRRGALNQRGECVTLQPA